MESLAETETLRSFLPAVLSDFGACSLFSTQSKTTKTKGKRRVRRGGGVVNFDNHISIWYIESRSDMTKKQRNALWYPVPEDSSFSRSRQSRLKRLMCQSHAHDGGNAFEESESRSDEDCYSAPPIIYTRRSCANETRTNRRSTPNNEIGSHGVRQRFPVAAVLSEQENQREEGLNDPQMIAKMYQQCSSHSLVQAQLRARHDAQDIREYYNNMSTELACPRRRPPILSGFLLFRRKRCDGIDFDLRYYTLHKVRQRENISTSRVQKE
jgi:hypothetical protein